MTSPASTIPLRRVVPLLVFLTVLLVVVWKMPLLPALMGTAVMSLPMHIFTETFAIVIAGMVFGLAYTASGERPLPIVFLGCALLMVGLLDFGHMLSFYGMPDFVTPADSEKALNFWLAARLLFAGAMVAFSLLPWRPLASARPGYWMLVGGLALVALIYWLALWHQSLWPRTYVVGQGLTPFKIGAEWIDISLLLLAAVLVLRRSRRPPSSTYDAASLIVALIITCLSEISFTVYANVADVFNLLGHLYKIIAFAFLYRAVFVARVREPFARLRQAHAEVAAAKEEYATLAELSPVGIFRTDAAGHCLYVNDRWQEMAGISLTEALGNGWVKAIHHEDREWLGGVWTDTVREPQEFQEVFRFLRPDGRVFWVYGQAKPERDRTGTVVGLVGTVTDISERIEAEEQLLQSEERFRTIMDSLDALVYVADLETYDLLFINRYGRARWGEVTGRKCWQVLQEGQSGPCAFCTNDKLLAADGKPAGVYSWEIQNTVTGQWFDCRDQAIRWPDGRLVRLEIATDITARKTAEKELQAAKEQWELIFTTMGDVATIQDADHRIVRANRQAGEILGMAPEALIGRFCYELFHGGSAPCEGCPVTQAIQEGTTQTAEITHGHLGKTFSVSASIIDSPEGTAPWIIYIARDITAFKAMEGQLRQAQKMEAIGTLAGGIAHDFNNILTPILGYSQLIDESLPPGSPLSEPARQVLAAGNRARDLVQQILSFSRQTARERSPIQVQLLVKEVLKLLRASLPTTIEIRQDIDSHCGPVLADPTSIHQVIMNLCTNAYHAMRETGGVLAVSLAEVEIGPEDYVTELHLRSGPYLRLEVSDTGCGMSPQTLERIFEPYFTTKAKGEGTGLGLAVVHGIVTGLGGHITVYSELGQGTTFHVYLPKYLAKEVAAPATGAVAPVPGGHEHILVVDDEPVIAELMERMLTGLGYQVTACIDPRQALAQFEEHPEGFAAVITDMAMPHLNGAELAQRLLASRPQLPIILATGFSEIINEEKAVAIGIRRLVMKPVLREQLARVLREVLDQPGPG